MRIFQSIAAAGLLGLALGACAKAPPGVTTAKHEHHAPHGGTAIALSKEEYHLELVRDAAAGKLTGYVLDGEMEDFIRTKAPAFEIVANVGGQKRPLNFEAIANPATGETVGDTSQFEAQADWLKTESTFDAELTLLKIRNTTFLHLPFNFPKGNEKP